MKNFLKKNAYYIIVIVCAVAIAAIVSIAIVASFRPAPPPDNTIVVPPPPPDDEVITPPPGPEEPVITKPIVFITPVQDAILGHDYSLDFPVWHATLKVWRVHMGIDYIAPAGTKVYAAYDGTVESVTYDALEGYTIIIKHEKDVKTLYGSLDEDILVSVGDKVKTGDVIGKVGMSSLNEFLDGPHLHFEAWKNGERIDPNDYFGEK